MTALLFLGLFVMFIEGSHAMVTSCNATQTSQCSVSAGGTVYIQLMTSARGYELTLKRNISTYFTEVFSMKQDHVYIQGSTKGRSHFFIDNGTFMLINVSSTDRGVYILKYYDSNGVALGDRRIELNFLKYDGGLHGDILKTAVCYGSISVLVLILIVVMVVVYMKRKKVQGQAVGKEPHPTPKDDGTEHGSDDDMMQEQ